MGFLSKIFKGIKKLVKKIFKPIGDAIKAIGGLFGLETDIPDDLDGANRGALINTNSNIAAIPVVYGRKKIGGTRALPPTSGGPGNQYLYMALVLCEGEIEAIDDVYIDDVLSTDTRFNGHVIINKHLGSDNQLADTMLMSAGIGWTVNDRFQGLAYLAIRLKWNPDVFSGVPKITCWVRGRKVVDPRLVGSIGAWSSADGVYSTNPALCLLDYQRSPRYGKGLPVSELDIPAFEQLADDCDTQVESYTGGPLQPLFTCNTRIDTSRKVFRHTKDLLNGMRTGMPLVGATGLYSPTIEREGVSVLSLNDDHVIGGVKIQAADKRGRYNRVIATFINNDKNAESDEVQWPPQDSVDYANMLAEDGGVELDKKISLPTIVDAYTARHLCQNVCLRSRKPIVCQFLAGWEAAKVIPGSIIDFTYPERGWDAKPFRVRQMKHQANGFVSLVLIEHHDSLYPWTAGPEATTYSSTNLPDPFTVATPVNVAVSQAFERTAEGTTLEFATVTWDAPDDAFVQRYEVKYQEVGGAVRVEQLGEEARSIKVPLQPGKTYSFSVRSANAVVRSPYVTVSNVVVPEFRPPMPGGMARGGTGDLVFEKNKNVGGTASNGNIRFSGATFFHPDGTVKALNTTGGRGVITTPYHNGVGADHTGIFYLMFSAAQLTTRFVGWADVGNLNVAAVRYDASANAWYAVEGNGASHVFTPAETDCLLAEGYRSSTASPGIDTLTSLVPNISSLLLDVVQAIEDAAGAAALAGSKITVYFQSNPPNVNLVDGDLWVDENAGNALYRYNQSITTWVLIQDSQTALTAANLAQAVADGKIRTWSQPTPPVAEGVGDFWIDESDNNNPYRWSGSAWVSIRDGAIAIAQAAANQALADAAAAVATAQGIADGVVEIFFENDPPVATGVDDVWFDLNDGNKAYRWSGSSWVSFQDGGILEALLAASGAQATADGKVKLYYTNSDSPPASASEGDLWSQLDTGVVLRWDGSGWTGTIATVGAPPGTEVNGVPVDFITNPPENYVADPTFQWGKTYWSFFKSTFTFERGATVPQYLTFSPGIRSHTGYVWMQDGHYIPLENDTDNYTVTFRTDIIDYQSGNFKCEVLWYDAALSIVATETLDTVFGDQSATYRYQTALAKPGAKWARIRFNFFAFTIQDTGTAKFRLTDVGFYFTNNVVPTGLPGVRPQGGTANVPTVGTGAPDDLEDGEENGSYTDLLSNLNWSKIGGQWIVTGSIGAPDDTPIGDKNVAVVLDQAPIQTNDFVVDPYFRKSGIYTPERYWR